MKVWLESLCSNPFRLFFSIGWLYGIWAPLTWVVHAIGGAEAYPGIWHAELMYGGFFLSFVIGFLLTAVPRFTDTHRLTLAELLGFLGACLFLLIGALASVPALFYGAALMNFLFLGVFGQDRFRHRKSNPPFTFVFVALGLLLGGVGFGMCLLGEVSQSRVLLNDGRHLIFHGMVLSLTLGVGGRLIPGILGWVEIVKAQRKIYDSPGPFLRRVPLLIWILALIFAASFPLEWLEEWMGRGCRALVVTFFAFRYWRLHRTPIRRTPHTLALRLACFSIVLGSWAYASSAQWGVSGAHLMFVGGFVLLTLMVASRVIAAHGEGTQIEERSMPYLIPALFVLVAAITRVYAGLTSVGYFAHLAYAAVTLALGVLAWGFFFGKKMWQISTG